MLECMFKSILPFTKYVSVCKNIKMTIQFTDSARFPGLHVQTPGFRLLSATCSRSLGPVQRLWPVSLAKARQTSQLGS